MKTVELKIRRQDGQVEIVDVTKKFINIDSKLLSKIRQATFQAGKGQVLEAVISTRKSNIDVLVNDYNNTMNEGGEGYLPPEDYFTSKPEFKTWNDVSIIN